MASLATVVREPHLPYLASIPGGLQHGRMIRINGRMLEHDRFNVNIQCSPAISPLDEVNLHLSVRPNESAIVRNHYTGNAWGAEERFGGCPIHYNTPFELLILAEGDKFKVAVNGRHFCEFRHRLPLTRATYFYIDGRVVVNLIALEGDTPSAPPLSALTSSMPSYQPPYQPTPPYQQRPTYQPPMYQPPSYQPPSYQPPSYQPATPYQPMNQHIQHHGSHHTPGAISTSTYATPTHHHTSTYHADSYYQPPSGTVTVTNPKSGNNTALKVAAGIGGIGIGAYALSKIFDNSDSD